MNIESLYQQVNDRSRREFPADAVHELIAQQASKTPESIAVLSGNDKQTYRELESRSNQLAGHLRLQGIGRGDLVGVCCSRNIDVPALLIGILKAGAGYVPLDPDYPADRLSFMVQDSNIKHIVAHDAQRELVRQFSAPATIVDRDWTSVVAADPICPFECQPEQDIAYVIYTSGSTGKPKGVLVPHGSMSNMLWSLVETPGFTATDRILATTTLSFDISVVEIFLPLIVGGSVAIVSRETAKDNSALVEAIRKFEVTLMQATPAMWRMVLESDFAGRDNMKFITAGEPLPRDLIDPMLARCGELWNFYGPTETTVYSSGSQIKSSKGRILIGEPIANTEVFIVDENDQLCPPETPGELLIAGQGVTSGYLNRDQLNSEKFIEFRGKRTYRTGDLAQLTVDGQLDHLGRIDNQIKLNGHRIELDEIDATIASQDGVRRAATVLREDRPGDKRLVSYILPTDDKAPDVAAIRESLQKLLPEYMVPSSVEIVEKFPLTPSGKLDRKAFPAPSSRRIDVGVEFVPPRSELEKTLAGIWQTVLQVDQVGIEDNFFDIGGNSIRAVKVVKLIKERVSNKISVAEFFDNPTIHSFCRYLSQTESSRVNTGNKPVPSCATDEDRPIEGYAIVGLAARFPGASNVKEYWRNLTEGRETIRFFSHEELDETLDERDTTDPNYVAARGIIENADHFDARFFNTTPRNAELIDPQQRIMLELSWSALEDAGIVPNKTDRKIGIWAGTYSTSYFVKNILTNPELVRQTGEFQIGVYNEKDYIATRVAHALNFTGPAINVNTACSTSLVALAEACKSLDAGHCDVALAGGASVTFPQNSGHLHQEGSIFSPDGHCRPFDARAAGTLFSDGAGVVVVKRLADAVAANDRIYAVVKGFGVNNDGGEKASFSAPSIQGQADAISMAYREAGISPESVGYIEAHGTATPIGDPIEVAALETVFRSEKTNTKKQFCALGSVKSNIGHTVAAAGVAGLIKVALSLHFQKIPATLHFQEPNPQIDFADSPFFVCDSLTPWKRNAQPRRAGVSSFGVGGTNAHVLLEEAPATVSTPETNTGNTLPISILPISGKSQPALEANVANLSEHLSHLIQDSEIETTGNLLNDIAHTLQTGRDEFSYRAAVVCRDLQEAADVLETRKSPRYIQRKTVGSSQRDVVFMFPGQGSQYVRMGQDLYDHSTVFRGHLDHCAEILKPLLGRDLRDVLFPQASEDEEDRAREILKNTQFTQPALFALGYSLAQLWIAWGIQPKALMGHSIGEFAAACTAGVFSLEDGLKMIAERGRAMQALPGGSMMSVRMPGHELEPMLWGDMAIGSFNGPQLCVVAGPDEQVAKLQQQLETKEIACRHLHTSHAFHSPMMDEIVQPFSNFVGQFALSAPTIPILSTVTGDWLTDAEATDPNYWAEHLRKPVRFSEAVVQIWNEDPVSKGDPSRILIELGPRKTLATLSKQHATDPKNQIAIPTLSDNADDHNEWKAMLGAVAQLWLAGAKIDWAKISGNGKPTPASIVSLPTYAFQRKRYFVAPGRAASKTTPSNEFAHNANIEPSTTTLRPNDESCSLSSKLQQSTENDSPEQPTMSRIANITQAIAAVFEDTSGFELAEFDSETTFFEMGLDSLVLTQTATALKKEMGVDITFRQLLEETPTVDALAHWLDSRVPVDKFQPTPQQPQTTSSSNSNRNEPAVQAEPAPRSVQTFDSPPAAQPSPSPQTRRPSPAPLNVAEQSSTNFNFANTAGGGVQAIVQNQLQLMAAQLQLLSGQPITPPSSNESLGAQQITANATTTESNATAAVAQDHFTPAQATSKTTPEQRNSPSNEPVKKAKRFDTVKLNDGGLSQEQQQALDQIVRMNNAMMPKSKAYAQLHRKYLADPRTVSGFRPNMKEMTHPIVVERSKGVSLWDIDGNEYIDFTCGFGSNILGHTNEITVKAITDQVQQDYAIGPQSPLAGEVAKLFCEITGNERMAFSNTGSEAVLGCTRLARNATGKDLIVTFNGDYHGILDEVIVRGSKKLKSFPAATGIPKTHVGNTLVLDYGTPESMQVIQENLDDIAAILVEPVQSRTPELQPREFLLKLREMTANAPAALIFDEVISGLRIGLGGAQEHFGIQADLASYGKIVGGGMPIGIVAGKAEYMDGLDGGYWEYGDNSRPEAGMTYFAGTFVRHPLTLAASKAILEYLRAGGQSMYDQLNSLADYLADESNQVFNELDAPLFLANFGSLFKIQFKQELVYSEVFFAGLRRRGMHIWDHRPCLLTLAHTKQHVDQFVSALRDTVIECQRYGFMPGDGHRKFDKDRDSQNPPQVGARLGKDEDGNPGWFLADPANPGQFLQVGLPLN